MIKKQKSYFDEMKLLSWGDKLFGTQFTKQFQEIENEYKLDAIEKKSLIHSKLSNMLQHAAKHCKYYNSIIPASTSVVTSTMLPTLPILTKAMMVALGDQLLYQNGADKLKWNVSNTGGTTAKSVSIFQASNELDRWRAYQLFFWKQCGYRFGDKVLQIGATKRNVLKAAKDYAFGVSYQHTKGLTEKQWLQHIEQFKNGQLQYLVGYPSRIRQLAQLVQEKQMGKVPIKGIITVGDKVLEEDWILWQNLFDCKMVETYGTTEGAMIGFGKNVDSIEVMIHDFLIEIVDKNNMPCQTGQPGYILVTSLQAKAMPLIRYKIGDIGVWIKSPEETDRPILRVIGRSEEILGSNSAGEIFSIRNIFSLLHGFSPIEHFRLVQTKNDLFDLEYIGEKIWQADMQHQIVEALQKQFGLIIASIRKSAMVPRYASGKPMFIQWLPSFKADGHLPW